MLCRVSEGTRWALAAARPAAVVKARGEGRRIAGLEERLRAIMSWCMIRSLELSYAALGPADIKSSLEQVLRQCSSSLAHLNLFRNQIGAEGAGKLAEVLGQCSSSLAHLNLSCNQIGAEGAGMLAGVLEQCSSLAHLDLSSNQIGAEGPEMLAGVLGQCLSLAHLDLSCN